MPNIVSVGGNFCFQFNERLAGLGFTSLTTVGGDSFEILANAMLPTCVADNLQAQLVGFTGSVDISGNDDDGTCP